MDSELTCFSLQYILLRQGRGSLVRLVSMRNLLVLYLTKGELQGSDVKNGQTNTFYWG